MPTGPDSFPATGVNSLASYGVRAAARIIDTLIIAGPVLLAATVVLAERGTADQGFPRWSAAVWFALAVTYDTVLVAWKGQTVGMLAVGIKVARIDNGRRPSWAHAGIRIALPAMAAALPFDYAIVVYSGIFTTAAWNPMRRGWHDKAAGTVVVATR